MWLVNFFSFNFFFLFFHEKFGKFQDFFLWCKFE
jgi:hypothetical protein